MRDDAPWEPVPGFPGYERNRFGEFRTWVKRGGGRKSADGTRTLAATPRRVVPWPDRDGYLRVSLSDANHKRASVSVAATVLEMNVGPRPPGMMVCHFPDRTRTNNDPSNLRWGTNQDNVDDMQIHGTHARGDRSGRRTKPESYPRGDEHWTRLKPELVPRGERHGSRTKPESIPRGERSGRRKHPERWTKRFGESATCVKLKEADVVEAIALLYPRPRKFGLVASIAKRLGVARDTIAFIDAGITWPHIPRPGQAPHSEQLRTSESASRT